MPTGDEAIRGLREALKVSPDNIPLRIHLAESLVGFGRFEEAEDEFRAALALAPEDTGVKLGLANVYLQQDRTSQAIVIVEDLCHKRDTPARAYVLYAIAELTSNLKRIGEAAEPIGTDIYVRE